jgi:5'-3' exonuclease
VTKFDVDTASAEVEAEATPVPGSVERERVSADCDVLLVDVSHLFWSAWHASANEEIGMAYPSTIDRLAAIQQLVPHQRMAVCLDWPPYWRLAVCSEYKAQRARPSDNAVAQFRRVRDRLKSDGLTLLGAKGFEADDVIGTVVSVCKQAGLLVTIATGDKDLMQCVCETVRIFDTKTDAIYGPEQVAAKYGVGPDKIRDLLTLTGDTSDNVPGIRGVGIKKAAWLINTFGGWQEAVAAAHEFSDAITPKLGESLRNHTDYELSWELVGLREDVPLPGLERFIGGGSPKDSKTEEAKEETTPKETTPMKISLESIDRGKRAEPFFLLLYGPEGTGKSSFAADAPSPIFFDLEDGTGELDVHRMPKVETWEDLEKAVAWLLTNAHPYKTVVFDTLDALELLIHKSVCKEHGVSSIGDIAYGKGTEYSLKIWHDFVVQVRKFSAKGMHAILLAHSAVKTFSNPRGPDYDRFELNLAKRAAPVLKDAAKAVLFVTYDDAVKKEKTGKSKALGDGSRVVYTEHRPAFDAKNRYGLPFEMPLNWAEFEAAARSHCPATPEESKSELASLMPDLPPELQTQLAASIERVGDDAGKLAKLVDWARAKASGKEAA